MKARARLLFLSCLFLGTTLIGSEKVDGQDAAGSPIVSDAQGKAILERMLDTLKKAETMSYQCAYQWASDGQVLGKAEIDIWLKKPYLARMEAKPAGGQITGVLVADGKQLWIYWPQERPYYSMEQPEDHARSNKQVYMRETIDPKKFSLSHKAPHLGAGASMLVHQPSRFHGYVDSLQPYFDGVRLAGTESVEGEECDVIETSYAKGQRYHRIWVARQDHLPRLLKETIYTTKTITVEERWSKVNLNAVIPDEKFVWQPPPGWKEWRMPSIETALLPPGTPAVDFTFNSADGGKISLSDYKGKVVWLVFWRIGCPPCRVEFPYLEKLHRQHRGQDLVILGFNSVDDTELTKEFLKQQEITFPNILDSSPAAQKINLETYQRGLFAVPLNYIIDREGKIAYGWYGYEKDDPRPQEHLKKLGIK